MSFLVRRKLDFRQQCFGSDGVMIASEPAKFRVLIYSHDTFGLGHLRRCRAIAHALVDHRADVSVLILSGSPIIGSYGFRQRVDFVRFPGVVKLRNGSYSAKGLDISIEHAIAFRRDLIKASADAFQPDLFLVDKEPLGLRGEVLPTLKLLKARGTRLVLGLRDILDDQEYLAEEWGRKDVLPALSEYYDDILVYGAEGVYNPLAGLNLPGNVLAKMHYTGYLRRDASLEPFVPKPGALELPPRFVLVTPGGGGDGGPMIEAVIRAAEYQEVLTPGTGLVGDHMLIVMGPFMPPELQADFKARAAGLPNLQVLTFLPDLDAVMSKAAAIVGMGGYNTFCEILSADRPSLIVPRTVPRLEQWIRADRMARRGVINMISEADAADPVKMAQAISALPLRPRPSAAGLSGMLDGFSAINRKIDGWLPKASGRKAA
jgi:predicted glycosyltransferase